ncbi:uncharacterized protein (DUF302 family) [Breoghania corrubedonensis]|uniref:Uncharacterized protein (DUF302 family) n=1 Tax=Breoghania corrubedonensis TaxID=665038 RepID=A0A2T5VFE4_9HYPH|nr:DUF302 domain-containing protein [Breoghania corrubedonensis]PTW62463.1 uncharacterized protein (DUF302 family) [Breoghania corrubedonensis]
MRIIALALAALLTMGTVGASAAPVWPKRAGWIIQPTPYSFDDLTDRLKKAIAGEKMNLVTQASASDGARAQGIDIPGNRVFGVFRNDYARRMLAASLAAGIEAPVRFYVTQNLDGTATLAYKTPHMVFKPYFEDGGDDLRAVADELDDVFKAIAVRAIRPEGPDETETSRQN